MAKLYSWGGRQCERAWNSSTLCRWQICDRAAEQPKRAFQIRRPRVELSRLHDSNMRSTVSMSLYPERAVERDQWIVARRPLRNPVDPRRPHAFLLEEERAESGEVVSVATIFLTNRECPWRCLMCDLWKSTLTETVPIGAIPAQIDHALAQLVDADVSSQHVSGESSRVLTNAATRQIKIYNSGSFFDPRAIPPGDYA